MDQCPHTLSGFEYGHSYEMTNQQLYNHKLWRADWPIADGSERVGRLWSGQRRLQSSMATHTIRQSASCSHPLTQKIRWPIQLQIARLNRRGSWLVIHLTSLMESSMVAVDWYRCDDFCLCSNCEIIKSWIEKYSICGGHFCLPFTVWIAFYRDYLQHLSYVGCMQSVTQGYSRRGACIMLPTDTLCRVFAKRYPITPWVRCLQSVSC